MEPWFWLLVPLVPPVVQAVLPARTARWRRARTRLRMALLLGGTIAAAGTFVNPLGPAVVWLGVLFLVACAVAVGARAMRAIGERGGTARTQALPKWIP